MVLHGASSENVGVLNSRALCFVSGDGIAQGDVAVIVKRYDDASSIVESYSDAAKERVNGSDGGHVTIVHLKRPIVFEKHDAVTHMEFGLSKRDG